MRQQLDMLGVFHTGVWYISASQRILHVDGDAFFTSYEIALDPKSRNRPVYVGGGGKGDGIVIAANHIAKPPDEVWGSGRIAPER